MTLPNDKDESPRTEINPETGEPWTVDDWGVCILDQDGNLNPRYAEEIEKEKSK